MSGVVGGGYSQADPPPAAPPLRRMRSEMGVQNHFGMLLGQLKVKLADGNPLARAEPLSRAVSAPARLQTHVLEANLELVVRALIPGGPDATDCGMPAGLVNLVRQVSRDVAQDAVSSQLEEEEDGIQQLAFLAAFDGAAFDWSTCNGLPVPLQLQEVPEELLAEIASKNDQRGECCVCMDECDLLLLKCQHGFCSPCLSQQLAARWPGPRVVFGYLGCGLCREPLSHEDLTNQLSEHHKLKNRVLDIAERKFCEDGLDRELFENLGREPTGMEKRAKAEEVMAVYMCADCTEPYCGGRVDCAQQQELDAAQLRCHGCEWEALAGADDRRCMVHGHRYAIFKCDSCCNLAVWNCQYNHYCERCHEEACEDKDYPCPGPELCPLGMPHPRNYSANLDTTEDGEPFRPFVVGCTACIGLAFDDEDDEHPEEEHPFGYPERDWQSFLDGEALLKEIPEEELHARLRARPAQVPRGGSRLECAERLLLLETGADSPEKLLDKVGGASGGGHDVLKGRLLGLGLNCGGEPLDCAKRLLLLLRAEGIQAIEALEAREASRAAARAAARAAREAMGPAQIQRAERQRLAMQYFLQQQGKQRKGRAQ